MFTQFWPKLIAASCALILCVAAFYAWRADRRDRAQLAAELAATKQLLAAADARQHDRDAQLAQTLAALAAEKRAVVTPAQVLHELPNTIPLPAPITMQTPSPSAVAQAFRPEDSTSASDSTPAKLQPALPQVIFPTEDLKPLYDFTLDCKACQAKLTTTQNDLADERTKTAALTKERDAALRVARGGSSWRRIGRAAKWFVIGAAAGALAAKSAH